MDCMKQAMVSDYSSLNGNNNYSSLTVVNNNYSSLNGNKYLHKKFKKMAVTLDEEPTVIQRPIEPDKRENTTTCPLVKRNSDTMMNNFDSAGSSDDNTTTVPAIIGRYVCPYCKMSCNKPSVLQKHIRAHTNERPYPCLPCGFAFKTRSNLYKHRRSRSHTLKLEIAEVKPGNVYDFEDTDMGEKVPELKQKIYKPKFHKATNYINNVNSNQLVLSLNNVVITPSIITSSVPSSPFKISPSPEFLQRHISKLISENQAIVETSDPFWNRKFVKKETEKIEEERMSQSNEPSQLLETNEGPLNLSTRTSVIKGQKRNFEDEEEVAKPDIKHNRISIIEHVCSLCDGSFDNYESLKNHILYECRGNKSQEKSKMTSDHFISSPRPSPGPRLGVTSLIDRSVNIEYHDAIEEEKSTMTSLKSLETLSKSPMRSNLHVVFQNSSYSKSIDSVLEGGEKTPSKITPKLHNGFKPLPNGLPPPIGKQDSVNLVKPVPKRVLPSPEFPNVIQQSLSPCTPNEGVMTILHGGREIPYVPGIPGPQTVTLYPVKSDNKNETNYPPTIVNSHSKDFEIKEAEGFSQNLNLDLTCIKRPIYNFKPKIVKNDTIPTPTLKSPASSTDTEEGLSESSTENKFLRPSFLPLKPGTFIPKRNIIGSSGLPLISPETPRPNKSYGQLVICGNAYTYLGLKCSTRITYCTLNKSQPMYVLLTPEHSRVSMYSNWKVRPEFESHLPGIATRKAMSCYDSRQRKSAYTVARIKVKDAITHSSRWLCCNDNVDKAISTTTEVGGEVNSVDGTNNDLKMKQGKEMLNISKYRVVQNYQKICQKNLEFLEDSPIYVRGRGRGRYICKECGIRCKKPSMLKKHIRTHTDIRPFTCKYCIFSFKTKGNLTKHMKSKAHYKKCLDMGIIPVPTTLDDSVMDEQETTKENEITDEDVAMFESEEADDDDDDNDDEEFDDDDDVRLNNRENVISNEKQREIEREVAISLLSLSKLSRETVREQYVNAGLLAFTSTPKLYPYNLQCQPSYKDSSATSSGEESDNNGKVSSNTEDDDEEEEEKDNDDTSVFEPQIVKVVNESNDQNSSILPIDLSSKNMTQIEPDNEIAKPVTPSLEVLKPIFEPALIATISSTVNKIPASTVENRTEEDGILLQTYLKERAMRDVQMKQYQLPQKDESDFNVKYSLYNKAFQSSIIQDGLLHHHVKANQKSVLRFRTNSMTIECSSTTTTTPNKDNNNEKIIIVSEGVVEEKKQIIKEEDKTPPPPPPPLIPLTNSNVNLKQENTTPIKNTNATKGIQKKPKAEFRPPSSGPSPKYTSVLEDGRSKCVVCNKVFSKPSQLRLHVNIHYFEQPYRCEFCAVSFRTRGHLHKHLGSNSHLNKVNMNSNSGITNSTNPRPFKCDDCGVGFRIHGHLAKHLRSKMHIMKLECLGKLPFGTYAEMERCGINMNDIDTTDCENSLESLQRIAKGVVGGVFVIKNNLEDNKKNIISAIDNTDINIVNS